LLRLRGEVCKLVENPCVGVIFSLSHARIVTESHVYTTIFGVVVTHTHTHTHIKVHTRLLTPERAVTHKHNLIQKLLVAKAPTGQTGMCCQSDQCAAPAT
jgi:hypothetical protein